LTTLDSDGRSDLHTAALANDASRVVELIGNPDVAQFFRR
jgi:hypothetical protein